jgi:hypothetical protein
MGSESTLTRKSRLGSASVADAPLDDVARRLHPGTIPAIQPKRAGVLARRKGTQVRQG